MKALSWLTQSLDSQCITCHIIQAQFSVPQVVELDGSIGYGNIMIVTLLYPAHRVIVVLLVRPGLGRATVLSSDVKLPSFAVHRSREIR